MSLDLLDILVLLVIGVVAGSLGGLLGIGGSVIMIPALALAFGGREWAGQHLYQASAMVVNAAIAIPAVVRHRRAKALRPDLIRVLMPVTGVCIVAGVLLSDTFRGPLLQMIFAVFLVLISLELARRAWQGRRDVGPGDAPERLTLPRIAAVGLVMGGLAGLLGIGGGIVAVPLIRLLTHLPLRHCIAGSAAVMCVTAPIGATLKVWNLPLHDLSRADALAVAAALIPTAIAGSYIGAGLTHRLSVRKVSVVFAIVLAVAAVEMLRDAW